MKKQIGLIVAVGNSSNNDVYVIGNDLDMPQWNAPKDVHDFKRKTIDGGIVVMGANTARSLILMEEKLNRQLFPLPKRYNIVITTQGYGLPNAHPLMVKTSSLAEAIDTAQQYQQGNIIWIMGGAQIYQQALEQLTINRISITFINGTFEGNKTIPLIDVTKYRLLEKRDFLRTDDATGAQTHDCTICDYVLTEDHN